MPKRKTTQEDIELEKSPGIAMLFGEVTTELVQELCAWIIGENISEHPPDTLTLMINSPGGELSSAFALIEIMQGSRIPIRTIGLGEIASAGLIIFMSGTKGCRILTPTCSVMSHHFSAGVAGNYHELLNANKEWGFIHKRIVDQYMRCTTLEESVVREKLIPNHDVFLSPTEALELGLADEIKGIGV